MDTSQAPPKAETANRERGASFKLSWVVIGGLVLLAIGLLLTYFPSPVSGTVYVSTLEDARFIPRAFSLNGLRELPVPRDGLPETALVETVVPSPRDASSVAYLVRMGNGHEIFVRDLRGLRALTESETLKRDLTWSSDGRTLAFSEISPFMPVSERRNSVAWSIVHMVVHDGGITVGQGTHPVILSANAILAITPEGIQSLNASASGVSPTTLVRTPVAPDPGSAFAATADGALIAWTNPADHSLQIFQRAEEKYYTPLILKKDFSPSSLVFSPDGSTLLFTLYRNDVSEFNTLRIEDGTVSSLGSVPGYALLTAWTYEK